MPTKKHCHRDQQHCHSDQEALPSQQRSIAIATKALAPQQKKHRNKQRVAIPTNKHLPSQPAAVSS
jgi:hypothetical protein